MKTCADTQISQKSQLQYLLTRKNLVPVYNCVRVGPPHDPRFNATVEFDGQMFESQQLCKTLKEAEQDAAKVALLALPPEESLQPKDESGFYKNLLQELAQKEGLSSPVYKTIRNGVSHIPTFSSTVEIEGESFDGDAAKTKKQAEISAAKVAYCQLKERSLAVFPKVFEKLCERFSDFQGINSSLDGHGRQPRETSRKLNQAQGSIHGEDWRVLPPRRRGPIGVFILGDAQIDIHLRY